MSWQSRPVEALDPVVVTRRRLVWSARARAACIVGGVVAGEVVVTLALHALGIG